MAEQINHMGPLRDGGTVAVIGGGPGGASCAISLLKKSEMEGREIKVVLFEPKFFGSHYNQCLGVLSPPIIDLLDEWFDIQLPPELFQRKITGYVLHSGEKEIVLTKGNDESASWAIRRVHLDKFLLDAAQQMGAEVVKSRVTNLEFHPEDMVVYHEGGCLSADVMVGAFGLDSTLRSVLRNSTPYHPPDYIEAVVTIIHPPDLSLIDVLDDKIHAYLPNMAEIEFAALVPKGNHISIVVAGKKVNIKVLKKFLGLPEVSSMLPFEYEVTNAFKGSFPNETGKGIYGDRYVLIGDSAGLVRPFKGKGINSAVITGHLAAQTILNDGISQQAFDLFYDKCRFLTQDLWYGRFVRTFVTFFSNHLSLIPFLDAAKGDEVMYNALYGAISGEDSYMNIVRSCFNGKTALAVVSSYLRFLLRFSS